MLQKHFMGITKYGKWFVWFTYQMWKHINGKTLEIFYKHVTSHAVGIMISHLGHNRKFTLRWHWIFLLRWYNCCSLFSLCKFLLIYNIYVLYYGLVLMKSVLKQFLWVSSCLLIGLYHFTLQFYTAFLHRVFITYHMPKILFLTQFKLNLLCVKSWILGCFLNLLIIWLCD